MVRDGGPGDRLWIAALLKHSWGDMCMAVGGRLIDLMTLPALVADESGALIYERGPDHYEIVALNCATPGRGIGSALIEALAGRAMADGIAVVRVVTTNDNLPALRFYQRRGFVIREVRIDAVAAARQLKPAIPMIGNDGIAIRDEIVLERRVAREDRAIDI